MPALEMSMTRKVYGSDDQQVVALNDVNLTVDDEMLILVCPSGSGKTTLLTVAGALLRPTSGSVKVGGIEITDLDDNRPPASDGIKSDLFSSRSTSCRFSRRERTCWWCDSSATPRSTLRRRRKL